MNRHEIKLYKYINKSIKEGFDEDNIKEKLISSGYDKTLINNLIEQTKEKGGLLNKLIPKKVKVELKPDKVEQPIIIKKRIKEDPNPTYKPIEDAVILNSKSGGLVTRLNDINEKVDSIININKEKDHKHFALPRGIKAQLKKLAQKNKVLIMLLRRNRSIEPIITDIKNGFVVVDGVPRNCALDFVFLWKGQNIPCMIVKEWDLEPVGTNDYYEAVKENRVADPMPIGIRMLEELARLEKGGIQMSPKVWVFIGLGVIALLWVLFGGGF